MKKKKGVTLLALVLTIVIMLLLAGIVIQMSLGENGLVGKTIQAKNEQTKAELYGIAKISYTSLSLKAVEEKKNKPDVEEILLQEEFTSKYNAVGDNITDKEGKFIETKENLLNALRNSYTGISEEEEEEETSSSWPKTVAGVTIQKEDEDKMILKLKVLSEKTSLGIYGDFKFDYGEGDKTPGGNVEFQNGEYIIKVKEMAGHVQFMQGGTGDCEIDILQWGKAKPSGNKNTRVIGNVLNIYEPEPNEIIVGYYYAKFSEIPEWLYTNKTTTKEIGGFRECNNITTIPENLFENCTELESLDSWFFKCRGLTSVPENLFRNNTKVKKFNFLFYDCTNLTNIPEGLFKNNAATGDITFEKSFSRCRNLTTIPEDLFKYTRNVKAFEYTFENCDKLSNIPSNLFKYNTDVMEFKSVFSECTSLTNIPEELFKYNTNVIGFDRVFSDCTKLTSIPENLFASNVKLREIVRVFEGCEKITSIPENLFKHNTNLVLIIRVFRLCKGITNIPENLFKYNTKVQEIPGVFENCTKLTSIPENLFKYNVEMKSAESIFDNCIGLTNIPENLFKYNTKIENFSELFEYCSNVLNIPTDIIEHAKKVKEANGRVSRMFNGCTKASNYNSLPGYLISWW